MALIVNGTTIPPGKPIKVNGHDVKKIVANGTVVWQYGQTEWSTYVIHDSVDLYSIIVWYAGVRVYYSNNDINDFNATTITGTDGKTYTRGKLIKTDNNPVDGKPATTKLYEAHRS